MNTRLRNTATSLSLFVALALVNGACSARRTLLSNAGSNGNCATDIAFAALNAKDASSGATIGAIAPNTSMQWELSLPTSCSGTYLVQRLDSLGNALSGSSPVQVKGTTSFPMSYASAGLITERVSITPFDSSFAAVTIQASITVSGSSSNLVCSVVPVPAIINVPSNVGSGAAYPTISLGVSVSAAAHIVSAVLVEDASKLAMNTFSGMDATSQLITGVLSRVGTSKVRVKVATATETITCPDASITLNPVPTPGPTVSLTANGLGGSPQFTGGTSVTIAWTANYATSCTLTPSNLFPSNPGTSGTITISAGQTVNVSANCSGATASLSVVGDGSGSPAGNGFTCSAVASPSTVYLGGAPAVPFPALPVQFVVTMSSPSIVVAATSVPAAPGMPGFAFAGGFPVGPAVPGALTVTVNGTIATPYRTVARFYALGPDGNVIPCSDAVFQSTSTPPTTMTAPRVILTANGFAGSLERPKTGNIDFVWNSDAQSCMLNFPPAQDAQSYPTNQVVASYGKITLRADQIHGGGRYGIFCLASGGYRTDAFVDITVNSYTANTCSLVATPTAPTTASNVNLTLNITGDFDYAMYEGQSDQILATPHVKNLGTMSAGAKSYTVSVFGPKGKVQCGSNFSVIHPNTCVVAKDLVLFSYNPATIYNENWGSANYVLPADASSINIRVTNFAVDDNSPRARLNGTTLLYSESRVYSDSTYPVSPSFTPIYRRYTDGEYVHISAHSVPANLNISSLLIPGINTFGGTAYNLGGPSSMVISLVGSYVTYGACQ